MDEKSNWHSLPPDEVLAKLESKLDHGLSAAEVTTRQQRHGSNEVTARRGRPAWLKFLLQFHQPLLYILLVAAGVSALLGEFVDAAVILGVVLVNAIVSYIQEAKAERAIGALSKLVTTEASVRRDSRKLRVPSAQLVPGDIVLLQSGDRVPADLRLIKIRNLQVEEAALTGESVPVEKNPEPLPEDTVLGDRLNLAFAGTHVTYGTAEGVVTTIGDHTVAGGIAGMLADTIELSTPLTRKIAEFSKLLLYVILALSAALFTLGVWRGESAADMFMAAVALAVGAIPEGLPAAVTITLAVGVSRMARHRAIIRKLPAVETLGSTSIICSDKTGTLTENQMTVRAVFAGDREFTVTGNGYAPAGEFNRDGAVIAAGSDPALLECLRAGWLCNEAELVEQDGRPQVQGDPTEGALLVAAAKAGLTKDEPWPRVDMIPFESEHMFRATLHDHPEQGRVIYQVGAMERLLESCDTMLDDSGNEQPLNHDLVKNAAEQMAGQGMRVLAFARKFVPRDHADLTHPDVAASLTLLGLQGMIDPPREEAIIAVRECQSAGIAVKMITGDHAVTAAAIASQLGITGKNAAPPRAITGRELGDISDEDLPALAAEVAVFARVAPEQKLRLVRALQSRGAVVAMTGDGVNDAPALKQADIGVAMGITGTDVAKGAADMILTDDNFASIKAAVEEGRGVYDNLKKFITWTLPTNGGEAAGAAGRRHLWHRPAHPAGAAALGQHDHRRPAGPHARLRTEGAQPHATSRRAIPPSRSSRAPSLCGP
jgi:cation-transporting ATPase F